MSSFEYKIYLTVLTLIYLTLAGERDTKQMRINHHMIDFTVICCLGSQGEVYSYDEIENVCCCYKGLN